MTTEPREPFEQLVDQVELLIDWTEAQAEKAAEYAERRRLELRKLRAAHHALITDPRGGKRHLTEEGRKRISDAARAMHERRRGEQLNGPLDAAVVTAE